MSEAASESLFHLPPYCGGTMIAAKPLMSWSTVALWRQPLSLSYLTADVLNHPIAMSIISRCSVLPNELIDQIIDHLHDNDDALDRCSRVRKSWLPACRFHLFSDVEIHEGNALDFVDIILSSDPRMYIRDVRLCWSAPLIGNEDGRYAYQLIRVLRFLTELPALKSITHWAINWLCFSLDDRSLFMANSPR
jgi:hypothetical protein